MSSSVSNLSVGDWFPVAGHWWLAVRGQHFGGAGKDLYWPDRSIFPVSGDLAQYRITTTVMITRTRTAPAMTHVGRTVFSVTRFPPFAEIFINPLQLQFLQR